MSVIPQEKKIRVVDDAFFMRTVLKDIVKGNGLATEVIKAADGIEGVKAYQAQKDSCTSLKMPRLVSLR